MPGESRGWRSRRVGGDLLRQTLPDDRIFFFEGIQILNVHTNTGIICQNGRLMRNPEIVWRQDNESKHINAWQCDMFRVLLRIARCQDPNRWRIE